MRLRIVRVKCYEKHRHDECYVVERRGFFGWSAYIEEHWTYDDFPKHFPSIEAAETAVFEKFNRDSIPAKVVVKEFNA